MIKKITRILLLLLPIVASSQDYSAQWQGYFSYSDIKNVSQGNGKIYAASENAIFSYDIETNEIETITTVNGLSGETISKIHYSEAYELLIIGYENGLIEIAFDDPEEDVLTILDIFEKPTIPPTDKNINHFNEYDGLVYISTEYGISVYDLERLEFGDTYYIGSQGTQIRIKQTVVYNDYIYAACLDANGTKRAPLNSSNLVDFEEWETVATGNFLVIEKNNGNLYAAKFSRSFLQIEDDNSLTDLVVHDDQQIDLRSVNNYLIVTTENDVFVYDGNFTQIAQVSTSDDLDTEFTSATIDDEYLYIGTTDLGLIKTPILNPVTFVEILPNGPLFNYTFSIKASANNLWVTYGDYDLHFNPSPLRQYGYSHLKNEEWKNIPYDSVLNARDLNTISINPFAENHVFISSFQDGLLEVEDDISIILHDQTNSGLESLVIPGNSNVVSIRQGGSNFDSNGVLWTTTGRVERPLKSYDPSTGQWQSYDFSTLINDGLNDEWGHGDLVIDSNGTKWFGGYNFGLIGYNENNSSVKLRALYTEEQNMPSTIITALALDNRNQIWFGTDKGLRVLYNTTSFFTEASITASQIIILEDGVAEELLFQQFITDIEVDGSNNKWVSTLDSGLFYFSSDGQETIYHFTTENSALPTNNVLDLSIDSSNGTVYIATEKGLVSFKAGGSSATESLEDAYVYPNPVRPTFNITQDKVKIKDISDNVNIKITDIEGNLVAEAETGTNSRYKGYNLEIDGGTAFWNGKNLANNVVASGVYLIMLSDLDTLETKVLKIMVVR
ncbi:ABC transporter substrate-binding protein [Lacinutrix sp. C3R15]|uniref:type IX secretion system anionic LPS delivery protein PorZ n=1 Tax=Flavobacteriaceae TaxID=49546 RepID=UPI001C0A49E9|nr:MULTISPECIES: two-component regulator propeller domain-containing protein [Flavobacteriaceae]MBU2940935.1 ABC transporter substrate-binding protein [Lacinutrix sp. C3R15]MDO6624254.1 ABC transporter substrate-binding protein [Oceanihabitans sp. 1_MG-2023]